MSPAGRYGPVGVIIGSLTAMAQTGGLDGTLLSEGQFYNTNYTKPLLFLADGTYLANRADAQHLSGDQWGMMNETGNYPGQAWLWLYTMWYQIPPMNTSANGDLEVWAHHDGAVPRVDPAAVHTDTPIHPALEPRLQADLATPLPRTGRRLSSFLHACVPGASRRAACRTAVNLAIVIESSGNSVDVPTPFCGRPQIRGAWCPCRPERVGVTEDTKGHTSHEDPPPQHPGHRRAQLRPPRRRRAGRRRGHDVDHFGQFRELPQQRDIECRDVRLVHDDTGGELECRQLRLRDVELGILELDGFGHEFELRLDQELPEHGQRLGCPLGHTPVRVRLHSPIGLEQRVDVGFLTPG